MMSEDGFIKRGLALSLSSWEGTAHTPDEAIFGLTLTLSTWRGNHSQVQKNEHYSIDLLVLWLRVILLLGLLLLVEKDRG
jgi:hypothetical protein